MSDSLSIPHVTTTPKPFGVNVEWKWPDLSFWGSRFELQYLLADGRLLKEVINWPVTEFMISGLKAGERLQVRLRSVAADGSARDWRASDWIEGVSSVDAEEIIEALTKEIRNSCALHGLEGGWFVDKTGKAYINEALIGDGKLSANYSVKMNLNHSGVQYAAGMSITNAATTKFHLSDDMREAITAAVNDVLRIAMKPGGIIWNNIRGR